jgi:hypothetical protein
LKGTRVSLIGLLLLISLSACSGGTGDTSTPPAAPPSVASAEGLWFGTTNTNRTVTGVVLDDGVYWFLYSVVNDPTVIAGVVQGDSSSQHGVLTTSNATDFSVERIPLILNPSVTGNYTTKQQVSGTITYPDPPPVTFTTTYDSDYESAPDVSTIAGTYMGPVALNETVSVTVSSTGDITGQSLTGCTFQGSFKPRAQGNVFDVTITFGPQNACSNKNATVTGVGFFRADRLYSAALNNDKTNGVVFVGTKQ